MPKAALIIGDVSGIKWQGYCRVLKYQYMPFRSSLCRSPFAQSGGHTVVILAHIQISNDFA